MSRLPALIMLGGAFLLSCGEPTATGSGRAEALIQDVPSGPASLAGTVQGNIFASLSADGDVWADLGSPNGITINLQTVGSSTTVHGEEDAPTGSYDRVRLVFSGVTVRVLSGSVVGGTTLTSDVVLTLGGGDNLVEVVVDVPEFRVDASTTVQRTIVFDLRSSLWLTAAALQAGTIADASLQAAITASTREDPR